MTIEVEALAARMDLSFEQSCIGVSEIALQLMERAGWTPHNLALMAPETTMWYLYRSWMQFFQNVRTVDPPLDCSAEMAGSWHLRSECLSQLLDWLIERFPEVLV